MLISRLVLVAFIAGSPTIAAAQFTTFIPPVNKVADSVTAVVVAQQKARSDSVVNMQLTNIKTWVDSAAGSATPAAPRSLASPATTTAVTDTIVASAELKAPDSLTMKDGQRAPETASALPLIALAGATLLVCGMLLVVGSRTPRPVRVRTRA